jgi:hypothetical protein
LEENQVVAILKALIYTAEEYIGDVEEANLERRKKDREYTHDQITIRGVMEGGRGFELELRLDDAVE